MHRWLSDSTLGPDEMCKDANFELLQERVIFILDRIEEADVQTQTDAFLDRPPTPLFIPAKTGLDVATQIQDGDVSIHT